MKADIESILEHEAVWSTIFAHVKKGPAAWIVSNPAASAWRDANRAMHLRDDGRGPDVIARETMARLRTLGETPVADIDEVAEEQGIGDALRRLGMRPEPLDFLLMRYAHDAPPAVPHPPVTMTTPACATDRAVWIETALSHVEQAEDLSFYRQITELEANDPRVRMYLGSVGPSPAGTAALYTSGGWGRIDDVATLPAFRRRGVATTLVARAVADSVTSNMVTYLYTELGGAGEKVYLKLGFEPWIVNVMRRHRA